MKPLSLLRLIAISSFGFATTLFVNVLDPALYGHKILQLSPTNPSTLLGFTTAAGSILVILVGPIVGALSDKTHSPLGRRLPYFLAGVPLMILAMFVIGLALSIVLFVAGVLLFRFGDNLIFTPFQALYPDLVPAKQRGFASGIKSLTDILAVLTGRIVGGELLSRVPEWGDTAILAAMAIPCLVLLLAYLVTWLAVRGVPRVKVEPHKGSIWKIYRESFRFELGRRKDFAWWLLNRFLFWMAFILLSTFLLLFVIYVIGLPEADAQRYLSRLSIVLGGAILIAALPAGRLADRFGRKPMVVFSCLLAAAGTGLVVFQRDLNLLFLAGGLIGAGAGIYLAANFAQLTDIVPGLEAGRFLGLASIAGAGGGAAARLLGGLVINPINVAAGNESSGYLAVYALAAILFAASALAALKMPSIEKTAEIG